jgi:hypothetical protein
VSGSEDVRVHSFNPQSAISKVVTKADPPPLAESHVQTPDINNIQMKINNALTVGERH